ncbi:hypothetical protein BUALT_Bualt03G0057200 [Buddleja alternifolia]|uniref:E2 ubiquitin-conjugating enzyme n=1 Tax=Buddleja alternifolia TaxID=168488 RepID=A0AAV6Y259_9LAMI|nr:hypothetical protein BUALT_Bualt03G0057200 [Buddleja alternifolia]
MDSDFDTLSDSSSSEYLDDIDSLYGGQAHSIFSSLEETIEKIDDFLLFERKFMYGDIVSLLSDPLGQTGKVINVDMTVDLEHIYGSKVKNINSKNLHRIRSISVGDYVAQGAWLGKVEKIDDLLTVLFDDGTKCQLSAVGPEKIISISPDLIEDPQYPFYPGQRVQVESLSVSRSTNWLCGMGNNKHEQGTVCSVEAGLVYVDWISCAVINGEKGHAPPCMQDSRNLSLLASFPHANWQVGDCCVVGVSETVTFEQIAVIVKTRTKVDVQWQNGSQSLGLDSHSLFPVNIVDVHDFWPDSYVLEKGTVDDSQVLGIQKWGIVKCVDSYERTVKVKWFKSEEDQTEEIVSAYELAEHPDYSFCLGEAVFRKENSVVGLSDGSSMRNHTEKFLSHIGIVVGFEYGDVEVKWVSGATSKVAPHEIYRVEKCEGTTATSVLGDENDQQSNEEFPVKENQLLAPQIKDVSGTCDNAKDSISPSLSQVAIGVFTSIFGSLGTSLINACRSTSEDGQILEKHSDEEEMELCNLKLDDLRIPEKITSEQIKEDNGDVISPLGSNHSESFKQFNMVSGCSDHHFVDRSMMSLQVKREWLKKVHQEWSILEKDLPETIYVRVYEERMDLVRAAIIGSAGTPYHDGLFFFDIYLPPQYPNEPPMVYYNSGGLRINPNLYESGKVCLSLLNTWTGSDSEVWNPKSSTILQVLLSLQALVLNEKPYFNEAGYDTQIGKAGGEKNSISYNENAFLVSCRSMLYLLRKPPKHFEALVDEHFRRRWRDILMACKAYTEGAPIGYPFRCGNGEGENQKRSSTGFKIMLSKLVPKFVEAFSDKGIECSNLLDQLR